MGFMEAADQAGKMMEQKRQINKAKDEAKSEAKDEAVKEQQQHEENKQQGMI